MTRIRAIAGTAVGALLSIPWIAAGQDVADTLAQLTQQIRQNPRDAAPYRAILDFASQRHAFPQAAQTVQELIREQPDNATLYLTLGHCQQQMGNVDAAIAGWQEALRIAPRMNAPRLALASVYRARGQCRDAMTVLVENRQGGQAPLTAEALAILADAADCWIKTAGTGSPAISTDDATLLTAARAITEPFSMATGGAIPDVMGAAYLKIRIPFTTLAPASAWVRAGCTAADTSMLYQVYGHLARLQDDVVSADRMYRQGVSVLDPKKQLATFMSAAGNIAHLLTLLGRYDEAAEWFRKSAEAAEGASGEAAATYMANNLLNSSDLAWQRGRISDALDQLYRADAKYGEDAKLGSALKNRLAVLGRLVERYQSLNQRDMASTVVDGMLQLLSRPQNDGARLLFPGDWASAELSKAEVLLDTGQLSEVPGWLDKAKQDFPSTPDDTLALRAGLIELKWLSLQRQKSTEVRSKSAQLMAQALAFHKAHKTVPRGILVELGLLTTRAALDQVALDDARQWLTVLDSLLDPVDSNGWRAEYLYFKARYFEAAGPPAAAASGVEDLIVYLRKLREQMPVSDNLFYAEQRLRASYDFAANSLVKRGKIQRALDVVEEGRAHTLVRTLQLMGAHAKQGQESETLSRFQQLAWRRDALVRELSSTVQPALKASVQHEFEQVDTQYKQAFLGLQALRVPVREFGAATALQHLSSSPDWIAVLWVDRLRDALSTWWIHNGKVEHFESSGRKWSEIEPEVACFTRTTITGGRDCTGPNYAAYAGKLASALLPGLSKLPDRIRLTIVPDPSVQQAPFAALYWETKPLIAERVTALSYSPSLQSLAIHFAQTPVSRGTALFVGIEGEWNQEFGGLPGAASDAAGIAAYVNAHAGAAESATDPKDTSKEALIKRIARQDLVVIATHGYLDPANPMNGYLVLPDGPLRAYEMFGLNLAGSRVVLSACQIGGDVSAPGGDILGSTLPLFAAGARGLLHAAWSVDNEQARDLVRRVLELVASGKDLSEALVTAQRWTLTQATPRLRNPRFWAGWSVQGGG